MTSRFDHRVLAAWSRIRETQPTYIDCMRGIIKCASTQHNTHCPTCRDYLDATNNLAALLGLRPGDAVPQDGGDPQAEQLAAALDAALEA